MQRGYLFAKSGFRIFCRTGGGKSSSSASATLDDNNDTDTEPLS